LIGGCISGSIAAIYGMTDGDDVTSVVCGAISISRTSFLDHNQHAGTAKPFSLSGLA
jgi:hypothetical protein